MKTLKFNEQTGGYKIDIYVNGSYVCSTDWKKTCKEAKNRYCELHPEVNPKQVKTYFDYK